MSKTFTVHFTSTVSSAVDVTYEDDEVPTDAQDIIDAAYDSEDMPGSMTHDAFGSASADHSGDWEGREITRGGEPVWTDENPGADIQKEIAGE